MPKLELTKHRGSGQWRKRIGGVDHYYGAFATVPYKKALAAMRRDQIEASEGRARRGPKLRVAELSSAWLHAKAQDIDLGLVKGVTVDKYRHCVVLIDEVLGKRKVESLSPASFRELQVAAAARWGYHKQRDLVTVTRMMFGWGVDQELIPPVRIPRTFQKPTRRTESAAEAFQEDRWVWAPQEFQAARRALRASRATYGEAALMLGLNAGLGNLDVATLHWQHIEEVEGVWVVKKPREKTGRPRMAPLWEETLAALGPRGNGLVLRTGTGLPLVGEGRRDSLSQLFSRRVGKPFYGLRHMFQTIGSRTGDAEAVRYMMGHAPKDMADHYTLSPAWTVPRLERVSQAVRQWAFPA